VAGFGRPGKALPEPEKVARAYELYRQFRSYRYVGEALGISHEAARRYVLEAFHADRLRQGELTVDGQSVAADELDKARVAGFLEGIAAAGIDRYDGGGGKYEKHPWGLHPRPTRAAGEGAWTCARCRAVLPLGQWFSRRPHGWPRSPSEARVTYGNQTDHR